MDGINLIAWVVVGAIAGWLASVVMRSSIGLLANIIVGIIGGFIGGFVLNALNIGGAVTGLNIGSVVVAFIGAVVLLSLLRLIRQQPLIRRTPPEDTFEVHQ